MPGKLKLKKKVKSRRIPCWYSSRLFVEIWFNSKVGLRIIEPVMPWEIMGQGLATLWWFEDWSGNWVREPLYTNKMYKEATDKFKLIDEFIGESI